MKKQFIAGYLFSMFFVIWALIKSNHEFVTYAGSVVAIIAILHYFDKKYDFNSYALWGFNIWIVLHIFGGLLEVKGDILYNLMLIPIVGEPYLILKYDQFVHIFCYFIFALLIWSMVKKISAKKAPFVTMAFITVMAATGIGNLNEIIEFTATLFLNNKVGGYTNTALDIVSNLIGTVIAIPFFKKIK